MAQIGLTKREQQTWFNARLEVAGYLLKNGDGARLQAAYGRLQEQALKVGPLKPEQADAMKKIALFVKVHTR